MDGDNIIQFRRPVMGAGNTVTGNTVAANTAEDTMNVITELYSDSDRGFVGEPSLLDRAPDDHETPPQQLVRSLNSQLVGQAVTRMICDHLFDYWGIDVEKHPDSIHELVAISEATAQLLDRCSGVHDERHEMIEENLEGMFICTHESMQDLLYPMYSEDDDEE